MLAVVLAAQGCGSAQSPNGSAVGVSTTSRSVSPVHSVLLASSLPTPSAFGTGWEDDNWAGPSADLENPPQACARFAGVYRHRVDTALREYTYLPTSNGYESGHAALSAVRLRSANELRQELAIVRTTPYRGCAEATAVRWFANSESGVVDSVTAQFMTPAVGNRVGV